jgi:hypothetical protein
LPCRVAPPQSPDQCLASSTDEGKTWPSYRPLFGKSKFTEPGFIHYAEGVFEGALDGDGQ